MKVLPALLFVALVACQPGEVPPPKAGPTITVTAEPTASVLDVTALEKCFQQKVNEERAKAGLSALPRTVFLDNSAGRHSANMAANERIWHSKVPPGYDWAWGENVGMGPDCPTLHEAFMDSPGHKANIVDDDWKTAGYGVTVNKGTVYIAEQFSGATNAEQREFFDPSPPAPKCPL